MESKKRNSDEEIIVQVQIEGVEARKVFVWKKLSFSLQANSGESLKPLPLHLSLNDCPSKQLVRVPGAVQ
jgi:hypothetical protein